MEVLILMNKSSVSCTRLRILRFCLVPWKGERESIIKYCLGRQIDVVQKFISVQNFGHNWWWANGIRVEYLPMIHHIAALPQSSRVTVEIECNTRKFTGRIIFMSMFNASQVLNSFLSIQRDLEQDNGHSSDLDRWKSRILLVKTVHKVNGTKGRSKWCWHLQKAHTQDKPIDRVKCDDPAQEEDLLQRYRERIKKLSQQDRVSKFCTDAGFLTTVEVGQYFMTKDTEEFSQFTDSVSWVHLPKRRKFIWTKGLDQREHQNWARIGSYNLLHISWIWSGNQNRVSEQGPFSLVGQNCSCLE